MSIITTYLNINVNQESRLIIKKAQKMGSTMLENHSRMRNRQKCTQFIMNLIPKHFTTPKVQKLNPNNKKNLHK